MKSRRSVPFKISKAEFKKMGYEVVDRAAELLDGISDRKVTGGSTVSEVRKQVAQFTFDEDQADQSELLQKVTELLYQESLFNGHPRFMGYITSSPTPIGILSDMLAASVNPNVGGWDLSPVASEIESQTIKWIAELIGYSSDCEGILVSGGNMANIVPFYVARRAKGPEDLRSKGWEGQNYRVYCSEETHTWIQKAADLSGMGTEAIRWIAGDGQQRMDIAVLRSAIEEDLSAGYKPFMIVGTAGTVSTGALDPLREIAQLCSENDLWFHVDGAYGAPVAALENAHPDFTAIREADSVALDPHKWLYSPLEAGCVLVKHKEALSNAFGFRPAYYDFSSEDEDPVNFYELGPQNSRGFRALKVWTSLLTAGRQGYRQLIEDDIRLTDHLKAVLDAQPDFEMHSCNMSIATFQYLPGEDMTKEEIDAYNRKLLKAIQRSGKLFLSNAIVNDRFVLRTCIVNFRTDVEDIEAIPQIIREITKSID
jgi:glutamate/tyrosine decarboxylase-like PLP-dependent enzyme